MLRRVLGIVLVADDAEHIAIDVVLVSQIQEAKRLHIARLRAPHSGGDGGIAVVVFHVDRREKAA